MTLQYRSVCLKRNHGAMDKHIIIEKKEAEVSISVIKDDMTIKST